MIRPLKKKKRFSNVYEFGVNFYEKPAKAIVCFENENCFDKEHGEEDFFFLAVSVSKRTAKKAVVRNRIKRLLRESVRHVAKKRDQDCFYGIKGMILIWYHAPPRPSQIRLKDVLPVIEKLFDKICEYLNNNLDIERK